MPRQPHRELQAMAGQQKKPAASEPPPPDYQVAGAGFARLPG